MADPGGAAVEPLRTVVEILGLSTAYLGGKGLDNPRLDAELLLGHVVSLRRLELYLHHDRPLEPHELDRFRSLLRRRATGEPLSYVIGEAGFRRIVLAVDRRALVPRPETEILVELALARLPERGSLLDLGTGSGALALSVATERPDATVWATDVSAPALALARTNAERLGLERVHLQASDLFDGLPRDRQFDVVAANLPYVATDDPRLEAAVRAFEPHEALFAGADGLDTIRRAVEAAPDHVRPGGALLLEVGLAQDDAVGDLLRGRGFTDVAAERDLTGRPRFVGGTWGAA